MDITANSTLRTLKIFGASLLIMIACLLAASSLPPAPAGNDSSSLAAENPNAVAGGMSVASSELAVSARETAGAAGTAARWTLRQIMRPVKTAGTSLSHVGSTVSKGVGNIAAFGVQTAATMVDTIVSLPANIFKPVGDNRLVGAVVTPSSTSRTVMPIISDGDLRPQTAAAAVNSDRAAPTAAAAAATQPQPARDQAVQWPLHGTITTLFGASDLPYQAVHTGLDISSGHRSGVMPVKAFKAGTVSMIIRSGSGLGNHVIIDHGDGLTSVYAHLYSIAVQPGQTVGMDSVVGAEGTTGASTGPHLHFEIRVNGQPVNPLDYIPGRP